LAGELLTIEQALDERHQSKMGQAKAGEYWERGHGDDVVPTLVAELRRLRNLILANETLAHMESVAWWSRDTLPAALDTYLTLHLLSVT
jgi:hypothetical protein